MVGARSRPIASVLLPVYNDRPAFLRQAIDSILAQTHRDFELIVADDGSEDPATLAAIERYRALDSRIRVVRWRHEGLTATLRRVLPDCRGEFVFRHDSDDWSHPRRFELQLAVMAAQSSLVLLGSAITLHMEDGRPLWRTTFPVTHDEIVRAFDRGNPFCHGAVAFRREPALRIGGYSSEFPCSQDYDFFWRLSETGEVGNLDTVLYHHRHSHTSITTQRAQDQANASTRARANAARRRGHHVPDASVPTALHPAIVDYRRADQLLLSGHGADALRHYAGAVRRHPFKARGYVKLIRWGAFMALPVSRRLLFERRLG